jgi:hypothetical protein
MSLIDKVREALEKALHGWVAFQDQEQFLTVT